MRLKRDRSDRYAPWVRIKEGALKSTCNAYSKRYFQSPENRHD